MRIPLARMCGNNGSRIEVVNELVLKLAAKRISIAHFVLHAASPVDY